jgi:GNAT superfamily N-acetyltransferase
MDPQTLAEVMEATWPPAARQSCGPFLLRDGQGGGKRVSAATVEGPWQQDDLIRAEAAMGAHALFLIRAGDEFLDAALAARGYRVVDPVIAYEALVEDLIGEGPRRMTAFPHWPPMQIARQICAKLVILGRANDRASGVAFVACHGAQAMLHALEVVPALRRQGSAQDMLRAAAGWALAQRAVSLSLVVTEANGPARALYARMGMHEVGRYHYRQR